MNVVKVLCDNFEKCIDMNQRIGGIGFAPIAVAAFRGHHLIVESLCANGANPNIRSMEFSYRRTPLEIARKRRNQVSMQISESARKWVQNEPKDFHTLSRTQQLQNRLYSRMHSRQKQRVKLLRNLDETIAFLEKNEPL